MASKPCMRIDGMSPTRVIATRLLPYWTKIDDQDRVMIAKALKIINGQCPNCPLRRENEQSAEKQ